MEPRRRPAGCAAKALFHRGDGLLKVDQARHDRLAAAANKSPSDDSVSLFRNSPQQARSSEVDTLANGGFQSQRGFASQMSEEPDKRDVRVPVAGSSKTPCSGANIRGLKVGALFCVLGVQMNSSDLVARQVRQEDIHALLSSPQRRSVTHFGNDERRAATGEARLMPANLNIGRIERARLRDYRNVEIANDAKSLGRSQGRADDGAVGAVDRHSDRSGYFLEDHALAIETDAANRVLVGQDKRRANVWMARKRHLGARGEYTYPSGVRRIVRRQDKRCLSKIELIGDGLHLSLRKAARIRNHRNRISAELPIGEDIDRLKCRPHNR